MMTTKQVQLLLQYLGYTPGEVDGVLGAQTAQAVTEFQKEQGSLSVDGIPGDETQAALKTAVAGDRFHQEQPEEGFWEEVTHFSKSEFRCRCGGVHCDGFPAQPQESLVRAAQQVRDYFGVPVTISSGVRCPTHNRAVGGVSNSRHLTGKAVDFSVRGFSAASVLDYVNHLPQIRYAYAIDRNFVHMDIL